MAFDNYNLQDNLFGVNLIDSTTLMVINWCCELVKIGLVCIPILL